MDTPAGKYRTVEEYISAFPPPVKALLRKLRKTVRDAAPQAEELISYNMPAYKFHGMLVYYAAYKNHIGFYPTPSAITAFRKELSLFKNAKGSVQFPIDQPLPLALIGQMVQFRVQVNLQKKEKS